MGRCIRWGNVAVAALFRSHFSTGGLAPMRIGVLTGGGDCGGLNAAIRAVVIRAASAGHTVVGVRDGWRGMLEARGAELTLKDVDGIVNRGGTILGSSRTNPAKKPEDMERVRANFQQLGIEAL